MKEFFKRFTLPTPTFWNRLAGIMAFLTASFVGVIALGIDYLPDWAVWFSQHAIAVSAFTTIVAKLAVYDVDKPKLK